MTDVRETAKDVLHAMGMRDVDNDADVAVIEAALAAAEERGRRRGVEEAAQLAALLDEVQGELSRIREKLDTAADDIALASAKLDKPRLAALASRDSGPQHKDWCALFGNPEAGKSCDCRGERK